jgi:hypothetical protein
LLILPTLYHERALPYHFVSYSSKTKNAEATSRNQHYFKALAEIKDFLGDKPLVLDREFSYLTLMENPGLEEINFVIRLKEGPKFTD